MKVMTEVPRWPKCHLSSIHDQQKYVWVNFEAVLFEFLPIYAMGRFEIFTPSFGV